MQNLHLGTIGWSYDFWKGEFYPNKIASKDYLRYYASQFNTVEVDSTFYRIPTEQTLISWKQQTPMNFIFSLKFPQVITHKKMLQNCENEANIFLKRAELLGEKVGPLLLQFPPNFGVERFADLKNFLRSLPKQFRYVVEVRSKGWLKQDLFSLLAANRVALAWAENPLMPQKTEVTTDFLYVRWEGDRKKVNGTIGKIELDRSDDLNLWANQIRVFLDKKLTFFGYFGKYFSGYPPSDIINLQKNLD